MPRPLGRAWRSTRAPRWLSRRRQGPRRPPRPRGQSSPGVPCALLCGPSKRACPRRARQRCGARTHCGARGAGHGSVSARRLVREPISAAPAGFLARGQRYCLKTWGDPSCIEHCSSATQRRRGGETQRTRSRSVAAVASPEHPPHARGGEDAEAVIDNNRGVVGDAQGIAGAAEHFGAGQHVRERDGGV